MTGEIDRSALDPIQATVTFLEMKVPPLHLPPAPMNRHIAVLRVRDIPLHFYRYLNDRIGRNWHWVNVLRLSDEELASEIHATGRDIRVLYLDGAPAGLFDLKSRLPDSVELAFFGLMEHATGQGLGRWFLGQAIAAGWSYGPDRLQVQTCTLDHPAALPLYQRLGFEPVAQETEMVRPLSFADRSASVMRD